MRLTKIFLIIGITSILSGLSACGGNIENAGPALLTINSVSFIPAGGVELTQACIADVCEEAVESPNNDGVIQVQSYDHRFSDYKVEGILQDGEVFELTGNLVSDVPEFAELGTSNDGKAVSVFVTSDGVVPAEP